MNIKQSSVASNVRKNHFFLFTIKKMLKGHCFPKAIILQAPAKFCKL